MIETGKTLQLTKSQYQQVCKKIYSLCGINLKEGKEELVYSRLSKRIFTLKLNSFDQYLSIVENDRTGKEVIWMIDALTTNKTSFYREIQHFQFFQKHVLPNIKTKKLRIWSAACSSGEEPYSIAIQLREELRDFNQWDIKILATDISTKVLQAAHEGIYNEDTLEPIPENWKKKHFSLQDASTKKWRISPEIRKMVSFARLNFMGKFPMRGPFDVIFCRNAMIYFDKQTQMTLVRRFYDLLGQNGFLFVGHSESLTGGDHNFRYVQPAIYQR